MAADPGAEVGTATQFRLKMTPTGLELVAGFPQERPLFKQGGAESGALLADDVKLTALLDAWEQLPEAVKDAILAMVKNCREG